MKDCQYTIKVVLLSADITTCGTYLSQDCQKQLRLTHYWLNSDINIVKIILAPYLVLSALSRAISHLLMQLHLL